MSPITQEHLLIMDEATNTTVVFVFESDCSSPCSVKPAFIYQTQNTATESRSDKVLFKDTRV